MPENLGMRRGIVIDNKDPKMMGRVKIFIPGVYPDEYAKAPEMLPWAEPAMGIFGGSWSNPAKGLNSETGVCSAPHAGTDGDGAQVWVFFEANDIRFPVYFAVAQSGAGWFANHNNQHVIKSDNVRVVVDEFDNHFEMPKETKVPEKAAEDNFRGDPEELNDKIDALGGVSQLTDDLNGMNGSTGFGKLSQAFGGLDGMNNAASSMGGSLSSLSNFFDQNGGIDKLSNTVNAAGGSEEFFKALTGTGSAAATSAIEASYGSTMNFISSTAQIGGVENLQKLASTSGGLESFCSNLTDAGGSAGIGHLANVMNNLGDPQQFKDFFTNLTDGAKSLESIVAAMASDELIKKKQQELAGELSDKEDPVTVCDSYTTNGNAAIKAGSKSQMKTRVAIRIEAAKNCAVDLHITGHVNLHIEGNVFREIIGNIYDTHIGDHYVYHKGSTFDETKGRRTSFIDNRLVKVTANDTELIEGSATRSVAGLDSNYAEKKSTISTSEEIVVLQNRNNFYKNLAETIVASRVISTLGDLSFVANNISFNAQNAINSTAKDITDMATNNWNAYSKNYSRLMSIGNVDIEGLGLSVLSTPSPSPGGGSDGFQFLGPVNIAGGMLVNPDISVFAQILVDGPLKTALEMLEKTQGVIDKFSDVAGDGMNLLKGVNVLSPYSVNSISLESNNTLAGELVNHASAAGIINICIGGSVANFSIGGSVANYTAVGGGIANVSGVDVNVMLGEVWPLTLSSGCIINTAGFAFDAIQLNINSIVNTTGATFNWASASAGSIINNARGLIGGGSFIVNSFSDTQILSDSNIVIAATMATKITDQVAGIANIVTPAIAVTSVLGGGKPSIDINKMNNFQTTVNAGTISADSGAYASSLTLKGLGVLTG